MRRIFQALLFLLVTFWAIIYENSRMLKNVPTYHFVKIFRFPREFRFIEIFLLAGIFLFLIIRPFPQKIKWICLFFTAFLITGMVGILLNNTSLSAFQDLFIRVVPLLFFIASSIVGVREDKLKKGLLVYSFFLALSILVAVFFQLPFTYYFEDFISGFFANAHNFATFLAVVSIVLFYDYIRHKRFFSLVLSIVMLVISILPSNEKVFLLNIFIIAFLAYKYGVKKWSKLKRTIFYVTIFLALGAASLKTEDFLKNDSDLRFQIALTYGVSNLGPVIAWPIAFNEVSGSPITSLFGVGSGQYGWIAAGREVEVGRGGIHSNQFDLEFSTDNPDNSGFLFKTNTWSSLLAEFGIVGFLIFFGVIILITAGVKKAIPQNRLEANLRVAFFSIIVLVFFQGLFTPYSNWSESILMFPAMYIASYFFNPIRNVSFEQG